MAQTVSGGLRLCQICLGVPVWRPRVRKRAISVCKMWRVLALFSREESNPNEVLTLSRHPRQRRHRPAPSAHAATRPKLARRRPRAQPAGRARQTKQRLPCCTTPASECCSTLPCCLSSSCCPRACARPTAAARTTPAEGSRGRCADQQQGAKGRASASFFRSKQRRMQRTPTGARLHAQAYAIGGASSCGPSPPSPPSAPPYPPSPSPSPGCTSSAVFQLHDNTSSENETNE